MSQKISIVILLATVVGIGILFFWVIAPFFVPLFFAGVTAILFRPLFTRIERMCRGRKHVAAALTTILIFFSVLMPIAFGLFLAGQELLSSGREVLEAIVPPEQRALQEQLLTLREVLGETDYARWETMVLDDQIPSKAWDREMEASTLVLMENIENEHTLDELQHGLNPSFTSMPWLDLQDNPRLKEWVAWANERVTEEQKAELTKAVMQGAQGLTKDLYSRTKGFVADAVGAIVGFVIFILSLHYFFADGESILKTFQEFSPLESEEEILLFTRFERICRGVILATLVAGLVQGILAGIGFAIVGMDQVVLLAIATMLFSFIPFLGATSVWLPVVIYLFLQERYGAGTFLLIYGGGVVSTIDNVIKPYVIHGHSNIHPLVALITVLGALQWIGLWGIFLGPIVAAFFYALLQIFYNKLQEDQAEAEAKENPPDETPSESETEEKEEEPEPSEAN
ncbi:Hypothetical protein PBC10988_17150 [Planctomycetales bacterium 10988]|nr:Hypothetical protein PBC10988_17150 [Planctomycetales bacterium 10988]